MAHAFALDTLQYSKRLQKVGFTEAQAEVQVGIIKEQSEAITNLIDDSLATKQDIKELDLKIENRVSELKRDIKELELKIVIKLSGIMGGMIAVAIAILGFLIKLH